MEEYLMGLFFEQLEEGTVFTSPRRTITEADIVQFAGLSGDFNPIHTDEEFAKTTRILHGPAGFVIATGLESRLGFKEGTAIAFLGMTWDLRAPIFPGDTIHVVETITSKRETSKLDRGIVNFDVKLVNQKGEVCQEGEWKVMMMRKQEVFA
jgi:acyl dehydratase